MSKLFTTSVGDVAVTAEGDPVGLIVSSAQPTVAITSPVSAERPIYRVSPQGVGYIEFLSTSRVTLDFGAPWVGAMFVTTLAGSYVVEIDSAATFVWGQYMPVRNILGLAFIEGFDINSQEADNMLAWMVEDRQGQLDWDEDRNYFTQSFRRHSISKIPENILQGVVRPDVYGFFAFFTENPKLNNLPDLKALEGHTIPMFFNSFFSSSAQNATPLFIPDNYFEYVQFETANSVFRGCHITHVPEGLFDHQMTCNSYTDIFRTGMCNLTPQSVENVLVSINLSATNNNLLNGSLGIAGDNNPLTTNAEIARQSLLAKGWTLTLDNITGL